GARAEPVGRSLKHRPETGSHDSGDLVLPSARAGQLRFGTICILGYVALSWVVRFDMPLGGQIASLIYPLDTFSMYARMPNHEESHLLIRNANGRVHRVTDFRSFDCAEPVAGSAARC